MVERDGHRPLHPVDPRYPGPGEPGYEPATRVDPVTGAPAPYVADDTPATDPRVRSRSSSGWVWPIAALVVLIAILGIVWVGFDNVDEGVTTTGTVQTAPTDNMQAAPPPATQPIDPAPSTPVTPARPIQ